MLIELIAALIPGGLALAAPAYEVEFLPVPADCQSYALWHGLDERGRSLGVVTCDDFVTVMAVQWTSEGLVMLETLDGPTAFPYGSSARGVVVGTAEAAPTDDDGLPITRPVIWDGREIRELATLGGENGGATAVNTRGTIVGACESGREEPILGRRPIRACIWEDERVRDLGDLGGPEAWANDVNERGWVVGASDTSEPLPAGTGFAQHAFVYDGVRMHDIGTLGGFASNAWAINGRGEIVGDSLTGEVSGDGYVRQHAFRWRDGVLLDLGTLGGSYSTALDINDRGQIVGSASMRAADGTQPIRAVLWGQAGATDLNDVTELPSGVTLEAATAIDDRGVILVNARQMGRFRVVLLRPAAKGSPAES